MTDRPIQMLSTGKTVRSLHGVAYTRLWNADLLEVVSEFATDFQPPQKAIGGGTGLYCGEQDMFAFPLTHSELRPSRISWKMVSRWNRYNC